ncbi:hypothetical protein D3C84_1007750 [compost metagenome]
MSRFAWVFSLILKERRLLLGMRLFLGKRGIEVEQVAGAFHMVEKERNAIAEV